MGRKIISSSRIDEQVLFTFLGVGLLSFIILGFRYANRPVCLPIAIQVSKDPTQGKLVRFRAETEGGRSFSWNFGDGETSDEQSNSTTHTFKSPGKYTVSVLVNESCTELEDILVNTAATGTYVNMQPKIVTIDTAYVNTKVQFSDDAISSTSWNWDFGEPGSTDDNTRTVFHVYATPGNKRVRVSVNGRSELFDTRFIYVREKEVVVKEEPRVQRPAPVRPVIQNKPDGQPLPAPGIVETKKDPGIAEPPPPAPAPKMAPDAPAGLIEAILMDVPIGTNWGERISKYVCGDLTIPVTYDSRKMTLTQLCGELKEMKQKKIEKIIVYAYVSKQTNCIQSLNVTIEKKGGLLDALNPFKKKKKS